MAAKPTWMSGGSGSGVYDPVTTADNVRVQYSDQDDGWLRFKGRKYNFGTYRNTGLKGLCDEIRNRSRPKCLLMVFVATVLLILLILIIAIASSRHSQMNKPGFEKWVNKSTGLNFLPIGQEGTVFIPFSPEPGKDNSYRDYMEQLNGALEPYKTIHIHNGPNIVCNNTYAPADAICQQPITVFGTGCVHAHSYGYSAGQPCILLTFTLPKDYQVRGLLPKDGKAYLDAEKALKDRFSSNYVGISCEPSTPEDKKYVGNTSAMGDTIVYNPRMGFPTYFFRKRTVESFVPPAVMVQFRTIRDSLGEPHMVRLTCTAWGKAMDPHGNIINDEMFTTSFLFRIY